MSENIAKALIELCSGYLETDQSKKIGHNSKCKSIMSNMSGKELFDFTCILNQIDS